MARTETLRPTADLSLGWLDQGGDHFAPLADQSDLTGISTLLPGAVDRFALPPLPSDIVSADTVKVRVRAESPGGAGQIRARLFDGTNLLTGPTWIAPASPAWFEWIPANAPDGGAWTPAKVDLLSADLEAVSVGFSGLTARELEVPVTGQEATFLPDRPAGVLEMPDTTPPRLDLGPAVAAIELPPLVATLDAPAAVPDLEMPPAVSTLDIGD